MLLLYGIDQRLVLAGFESLSPPDSRQTSLEAFLVSAAVVAIGEIGDKTQLATVALAARFDSLIAVVAGTTAGMLIADVPAVLAGFSFAG